MTGAELSLADDLPARVASRLAGCLPAGRAHRLMAAHLSYGRHHGPPSYGARQAAVIVLFYPHQGQWHLLLTERSPHVAAHAGQIGFPGGRVEPGESSRDAALRELAEEMGISAEQVSVVGCLSPIYLFASNYVVTPWVSFGDDRPVMRPNPCEVADVLEVPLADLVAPDCRRAGEIIQHGVKLMAPHFLWRGHRVWGGTAMMLAELIAVLSDLTAAGDVAGRERTFEP